jgi:glucosamine-6-phosphate deaminase
MKDIPWDQAEVFHMEEYGGLSKNHLESFRYWIEVRLAEKVPPGQVRYFTGEALDLDSQIDRYVRLVGPGPLDLTFVRFGKNGHIACNDPHVADFDDPRIIREWLYMKLPAGSRLVKDILRMRRPFPGGSGRDLPCAL